MVEILLSVCLSLTPSLGQAASAAQSAQQAASSTVALTEQQQKLRGEVGGLQEEIRTLTQLRRTIDEQM